MKTHMKFKALLVSATVLLALLASCSEESSFNKKIPGDWWPVHASGSLETDVYTASWNGDLDEHGSIEVTYVSKSNPDITVKQRRFFPALRFGKDNRKHEAMNYLDIRNLTNIKAGKFLKYKVENGTLFIEKTDENGSPTGELDQGHPYKLVDENTLTVDQVTYQIYDYYKKMHPYNPVVDISDDSGLIPVMEYE